MSRHLLCLTLDTDPDGLNGKVANRQTLDWSGLERLQNLPDELESQTQLLPIQMTWFIRADGQLETVLGSAAVLLEQFQPFWATVRQAKHELAWHPHLYRQGRREDPATIISDPNEAQDELERLWGKLSAYFPATSFRHGEGWHNPTTYATVEKFGFQCDSTAIPGRRGSEGHPMNWERSPNRPYFPKYDNLCEPGSERQLLEIPMNTWLVHAPYDKAPRLRYMNPAVHPEIFARALQNWENTREIAPNETCVWVMIFHPDEVLPNQGRDHLYSRSLQSLFTNLAAFQRSLVRVDSKVEWVTLGKAAQLWRQSRIKQTT